MINENKPSRKRVCVLGVGGGGFHFEVEYLLSHIENDLELITVYSISSQVRSNWRSRFPVRRAFAMHGVGLRGDRWYKQVYLCTANLFRAFFLLLATRPDCVLAIGTAQAVPFGLAGRLLHIPLIFIESITRVTDKSLTYRIVERLKLATECYVQWPTKIDNSDNFVGSIIL